MKNNYLKKVMAGIMAVTMMSSIAYPAVYADEPSEQGLEADEQQDYIVSEDVVNYSDKWRGSMDVDENNSLMPSATVEFNDKGKSALLYSKLVGTEVNPYEGVELPVDELNAKLENAKIEKRDDQFVLVSETIAANDKAVEVLKSCPEVREMYEIWNEVRSGWKADSVTTVMLDWQADYEMPDGTPEYINQDEIVALCNKLGTVYECISWYTNGLEGHHYLKMKLESAFTSDTEMNEERLNALNALNSGAYSYFSDISQYGTEKIIRTDRKLIYKEDITYIKDSYYEENEFQLDFEEPVEIRTTSGEKFIRFAGDSRKIEKVKEAPEGDDFSSDLYYYVEGEKPYITYKTKDGEIKTVEGLNIEPRFYFDNAASTLNRIDTGEKITKFKCYTIGNGKTDMVTDVYKPGVMETSYIKCFYNGDDNYMFNKGIHFEERFITEIGDKGDLNIDTISDLTDLSILSLALIGDMDLTDEQKEQGDVDNDGSLTMADLAKLRQFLSRKIETLSN